MISATTTVLSTRLAQSLSTSTRGSQRSVLRSTTARIHHKPSKLEPPTVLFSNNLLLVVNKPAGWRSVPNEPNRNIQITNQQHTQNASDAKCLVTYSQNQGWGGGSQKRFLLPMHRLDQPCTGVLLLGKTRKAATRIQSQWSLVKKVYYCVVYQDLLKYLIDASTKTSELDPELQIEEKYELKGLLLPRAHRFQKTVVLAPLGKVDESERIVTSEESEKSQTQKPKMCSLRWSAVEQSKAIGWKNTSSPFIMLRVETNQGRRHMIRALLGKIGNCPIAGDLRYDDSQNSESSMARQPLPDRSVALHAAHMTLPTTLNLGQQASLERSGDGDGHVRKPLAGATFSAPIPSLWKELLLSS
mmetsp:Transcript_16010/g.44069  ORF Transcript_16010/g.44069 Transcript_16010/m.44069 type:complete len:358 (-) Transcript_16010:2112-3185(-)